MSLADSVQAVSDMRLAVRDTVAEDLGLQEPLSEDHVEALQMQTELKEGTEKERERERDRERVV